MKREQVIAVIETAKLKMLETVGDAHPYLRVESGAGWQVAAD